ncbi:MAG: acyl-CoA dehydrogenase family protein [Dehalococcoidia bacterium]|nr:acyl-CoA dehydrogenase family protein [Dehalococcoidia bacterium]
MYSIPVRLQGRLYHDSVLPEESRALRSEVRTFVNEEVLPVADHLNTVVETAEAFPWTLFRRMAELEFFGVPFALEQSGRGLRRPLCGSAVVMEELAYASDGLATIFDDHCILPGIALLSGASDVQERYLKPLVAGTKVACMAITEPEAGSDLSVGTVLTRAVLVNGSYRLNGHKRFITNAPVGDFATTLCVIEEKLCMLVVDLRTDGVTVGEPDIKMGNKVQLTADVWFNNVEVPFENLLGMHGEGLRIALRALTWGRVLVGMSGVGMAQAALDESVAYMHRRQLFGERMAAMQYWQFKLADRATEIAMARDLCYKAALRHDEGEESPEPETAMAKYFGSQIGGDMARDAVQIAGGRGFMTRLGADDTPCRVEQIYRDCKIAEIYEGANEIQKRVIARQIFGRGTR